MPGWKRDIGRRLDLLIVCAVPDVRKGVRWNSPFYGAEGQGWSLNFHCFTKYVKVAFFDGALLGPYHRPLSPRTRTCATSPKHLRGRSIRRGSVRGVGEASQQAAGPGGS